ncbi:MAG: glycosyltransferase [Bacteroidales bacterium]|jgi:glycosyltransferase involved in cell wall biosynthesis|nr:glycosyltransferase [Bacteroidales bacterium]
MNFSVLLSLYAKEQPAFLQQSMQSVFDQTFPPAEVVLVLDGDITADLQKIVDIFKKQYSTILKIVPLEKNMGLGAALNEGLKHCSYELVARMDTDDICKPNRFEKQITLFEQNPQIDIASSWIDEFYDSPSEIISIRKLPETYNELKKWAKNRNPINHPVVMYKKSKVIECGGYEVLGFLEDYLLWMKMLQNNAIFYNIPESLLYFRSNKDMYKRRGGFKYAIDECKLQQMFYKRKMISLPVAIKNIVIRFGVRIVPNKLRAYIYRKFLR